MPVAVTCVCGQRFAAQDQLYGKQVKCPACGAPLNVPIPAAAAAAPRATGGQVHATQAAPRPAAPQQAAAVRAPAAARPGVKVVCSCGQAVLAPEALRGKSAPCPSCKSPIAIPAAPLAADDIFGLDAGLMGNDPLAPAAAPLNSPLAANRAQAAIAPASAEAKKPWLIIGVAAASAAVVLIVLVVVIVNSMSGTPVAQVPAVPGPAGGPSAPAPGQTAASAPAAPPASAPASSPANSSAPGSSAATNPQSAFSAPAASTNTASGTGTPPPSTTSSSPPATTSSSQSPSTATSGGAKSSAFRDSTPAGGMGVSFLPAAAQSWHSDEKQRRRGLVRVGDSEVPYGHFSWMTQLLPFLGHQKEYDEIDFNQPLSTGKNFVVGVHVIPAFLNPLDNRKTWQGHPFQGLALTHFAGMSGVEDARNVVAAALPRSDPRAGVFGYGDVAEPAQITDGTSQTIMVVGTGALANPWIMGGGSTIRGAREPYFDKVSGLGTRNLPQPGTLAVMADGSVRFISASVDPKVFRAMCTIHGSDSVDLERAASPFLLDSISK